MELPEYVAADLTDILNEIGSLLAVLAGHAFGLAHDIAEGHEHDHGDEQDTVISLLLPEGNQHWTYRLPADSDPDDGGQTYWQAFEAADDMITAWLAAHGVRDATVTETHGTGWSIAIPRETWEPTSLDEVRAATCAKIAAEIEAGAKLRSWRQALQRADRSRATTPGLTVEAIYTAAGVTREGYYKALRTLGGSGGMADS